VTRTAPVLALLIVLALPGCGGNSTDKAAQTSKPLKMKEASAVIHRPYEIKNPPQGPPPREVVVREFHEGSGPLAKAGDEVSLLFQDADYADKSGKYFYSAWDTARPLILKLGSDQSNASWDESVEGMRPGGRRELIMPASLAELPGNPRLKLPPQAETVVFTVDLWARG
jgi:peptidylprolyl isomerase